ncbi:MAG: hypothetical protein N2560_06740 [Ignavibacteria bacterium]|nr:hypothetical protein [Ignavibacteria bacterium]
MATNLGGGFGFVTMEEHFDYVTAYVISIIRLGYRFTEFTVSTSFVSTYILKLESYASGSRLFHPQNTWNDFYSTIALEQPFLRKTLISIGISIAYSRTPYQSWMLFYSIDEYLVVPEFFFTLQL